MMIRYALADFCGTIADFQTFDAFILYVLKRERPILYKLAKSGGLLLFLKGIQKAADHISKDFYVYKHLLVWLLRGIEAGMLKEYGKSFYYEEVENHLIPETMHLLNEQREKGIRIFVVSAGCDLYINEFAKNSGVYAVLATKLQFKNGKCSGRMEGKDCIGKQKILALQKYMDEMQLQGEMYIGITDSKSDLPMLGLCSKKVIISKDTHQNWLAQDMKEIIWKS